MMTSSPIGPLGLALAVLLLVGCSPMPPATTTGASAPPPAAAAASGPCIVGQWSVDVYDYEAQSLIYITSLDAPLEDFSLTGFQNLTVTDDGLFKLDTDITTGVTLATADALRVYQTRAAGYSTAEWLPGVDPGTIALTNWVDTLEVTGDAPEDSGLGGGVGFGAIPIVTASCDGDRLSLSGPDLPLVSHWTRQG